jgi:predicted nucleic acid-binding protein
MIRVLIDTDVVLDILLKRVPFYEAANAIWQANFEGQCEAFISAVTPVNVFYIAKKLKGASSAYQAVKELLDGMNICAVDEATLKSAATSPISDFEDAVQHASAAAYKLDAIVTRNLDDYRNATIPVYSPPAFLIELKKRHPPEDK